MPSASLVSILLFGLEMLIIKLRKKRNKYKQQAIYRNDDDGRKTRKITLPRPDIPVILGNKFVIASAYKM